MEYAERIEITFKSGETISYGKGEWDDYSFTGNAVVVKQKGARIVVSAEMMLTMKLSCCLLTVRLLLL